MDKPESLKTYISSVESFFGILGLSRHRIKRQKQTLWPLVVHQKRKVLNWDLEAKIQVSGYEDLLSGDLDMSELKAALCFCRTIKIPTQRTNCFTSWNLKIFRKKFWQLRHFWSSVRNHRDIWISLMKETKTKNCEHSQTIGLPWKFF